MNDLEKCQKELRKIQDEINKGVKKFFPIFLLKTIIPALLGLALAYLLRLDDFKVVLVFITTFAISLIVNSKITRRKLKDRQEALVGKRLDLQKKIVRILRSEDK